MSMDSLFTKIYIYPNFFLYLTEKPILCCTLVDKCQFLCLNLADFLWRSMKITLFGVFLPLISCSLFIMLYIPLHFVKFWHLVWTWLIIVRTCKSLWFYPGLRCKRWVTFVIFLHLLTNFSFRKAVILIHAWENFHSNIQEKRLNLVLPSIVFVWCNACIFYWKRQNSKEWPNMVCTFKQNNRPW